MPEAAGCSHELFCLFFQVPHSCLGLPKTNLLKNHPDVQSGDKSDTHLTPALCNTIKSRFLTSQYDSTSGSRHKAQSSTLPLTLDSLSSGTLGYLSAFELASNYVLCLSFFLISSLTVHSAPQVCLFMCRPVRVFQCSQRAPSCHILPS